MPTRSLLIDLYEFTMAAGYLEQGKSADTAVFDLYFRRHPFGGGYTVAAGLETAVQAVLALRFHEDDIGYLGSLKSSSGASLFSSGFLRYLSSFRFRGNIRAIPEGTLVFPHEPLLQAYGNLIECQVLESALLCHINFQTLVATKAARMWEASGHGSIMEFGLRRAPGPDGALSACRAAIIGGCEATSNVLGAATLGIPPRGTQAHSWVQSFACELEAFQAYARAFPEDCVLLVDTYDVLTSGVPNAVQVGKELERKGHRLKGIRIDSGDLAYLSRKAREMLDMAGLPYVRIVVSSDLDEFLVEEVLARDGKVDFWGIGTKLVTAGGEEGGALGGVYKMVEHNGLPKIKLSSDPEKTTDPGFKKVMRFCDRDGFLAGDVLGLVGEAMDDQPLLVFDLGHPSRRRYLDSQNREELLVDIVKEGGLVYDFPSLEAIRKRCQNQLARLRQDHRRLRDPRRYNVGLTHALWRQKEELLNQKSF